MKKEEFRKSKITLKDGALLLNNRYGLMYEHEKEQIQKQVKKICEKYSPKKVLEIGFGLGYSAEAFQDYGIDEHVIVEAHPDIYLKAIEFAQKHDNVWVIYNFIQDADIDENQFDLVFDDRCELVYNVPHLMSFPYFKVVKESNKYYLPPIKSW